jgi:aryl-alcohol dehydrogenase-like predicted oxidoreductase
MDTRQLGNSDLHITRIGVGAWAMGGGDWKFAWGDQDDNESIAAIHRALDQGINWIDTAAVYGLGHSEEVVGRALRGRSARPYLFTKCGRVKVNGELTTVLTEASIRNELESSLKRLGVDTIDLYQLHWPDGLKNEEGWRTFARLQAEGKIRWLGVCNYNVEQLQQIQAIAPVTSLQPPYSLMDRAIEPEILPHCLRHNIGVLAYSPMASGLLSGRMTRERFASLPANDWRRNGRHFQEPNLTRGLALAEVLRSIGTKYKVTAGVVAVAWTLSHPALTASIVGVRNPNQVDELLPAASLKLDADDMARIENFLAGRSG